MEGNAYETLPIWSSLPTPTGLPATTVPVGLARDNLPVGMQVIAPPFEDLTGIRFAELFEREAGGFAPPPQFQE